MDTQSPESERFADLSKQHLDYEELPDGSVRAILTVTLPGGNQLVFKGDPVTPKEAESVEGLYDEVGNIFGDIAKGIGKVAKGVVKGVKAVASSKVFAAAAKGLALVAPALGPLAPVALTASTVMSTTNKLAQARHAAARGNKKLAAQITARAVAEAHKAAPTKAATLLKIANDKAKRAHALTSSIGVLGTSKAKPKATPKTTAITSAQGALSPQQLLTAARSGKVFLLRAS